MSRPELVTDPAAWQARCRADREAGTRVVLVPTMGYLHEGHLSLLREARRLADVPSPAPLRGAEEIRGQVPSPAPLRGAEEIRGQVPSPAPLRGAEEIRGQVPSPAPLRGAEEIRGQAGGRSGLAVATIFVNPAQFGPTEDLARYPRDLEGDLAKCAAAGIDRVFAPSDPGKVYAAAHETWVTVERVSQGLCGASRPGHFRGVATIVAKLFNLTLPHVALFGEKDYQQLAVIRAMVRDLSFGIQIVGMPIVREPDGLALSSRNAYLSPEERVRALALSGCLFAARDAAARGERDAEALRGRAREALAGAGARVDYVEVVDPDSLAPVAHAAPGSVMLLAAFVGKTRLIDNLRLP